MPAAAPAPPLAHGAWRQARRAILQALASGGPMVVLVGPPGTGKTRLLREVEAVLRTPGRLVLRVDDGAALDPAAAAQVLLVDEADRLEPAALAALARREGTLVLLAAQPGFAARLPGLPHRLVALAPLRPADTTAFIDARVAALGLDPARLSGETRDALAAAAGGIPRLLNLLVGASYHAADMAGAGPVRPAHVREAMALRGEELPDPTPPVAPASAPAPAAVLPEPPPAAPTEPAPVLQDPPRGPMLPALLPPRALAVIPQPGAMARRWPPALLAGAALLALGLGWAAWPGAPSGPAGSALEAQGTAAAPEPATVAPVTGPVAAAPEAPAPSAANEAPPPVADAAAVAADPAPAGDAAAVRPWDAPPPGAAPVDAAWNALPVGVPPRVVVTYPRGAVTPAEAAAVAASLGAAGLQAGTPFPVARGAGVAELRYFFQEDRAAALRVQALGGAALAGAVPRLATTDGALPRPGAIELVLPTPGGPPPEGSTPETDAAAPRAAVPDAPPDAAVLSLDAARRGIPLGWTIGGEAQPGCCVLEVLRLGEDGTPQDVFAGPPEAADRHTLRLDRPGRYAWRVLTLSPAARRHAVGPWRRIVIEAPP